MGSSRNNCKYSIDNFIPYNIQILSQSREAAKIIPSSRGLIFISEVYSYRLRKKNIDNHNQFHNDLKSLHHREKSWIFSPPFSGFTLCVLASWREIIVLILSQSHEDHR